MEIAEVQDEESLERYLNALPEEERRQVAVRIASRAAARVLPIAVGFRLDSLVIPERALSLVSTFGTVAISATKMVNLDAQINPHSVNDVGSIAIENTGEANAAAYAAVVAAIRAAAASYTITTSATHAAESIREAILAVVVKATLEDETQVGLNEIANASKAAFWSTVREDLAETIDLVLWPNSVLGGLLATWQQIKTQLENDPSADWSFWIAWYERLLAGRDFLAAEMAEVLNTLGRDDWKKGPAHVNPMFDGVLGRYRAEDFEAGHAYGFRAQVNRKKDRLDLIAVKTVDLSEIVKKLRSALSDYKRRSNRGTSHNQLNAMCYDALEPELADFRKVISKYKENPQALHDEIIRYEKHVMRVLQDQDLPPAAEVASLIDDMRAAQSEICLMSEEVRAKEKLRTAIAVEKATEAQKLQAIRNCLGMMTDGTSEMELFAGLAVKALVDPDATVTEKQMAWQFAYRMGANAATTIKNYEEEVGAEKTNLGKRLKDVSDMAVAGDKFVDVLQEAVAESAPWVEGYFKYLGENGFPGMLS
ncbi:hypothetical protein SAMN05428995_102131 [Loktanella sp. DSM 29012]|uniref:hypothetical protein n=1 Tax=Loktanella sp. DSM 29012 TaxID=1881056 RepID=UPI0008CBD0DF|nr:hypothetical protein [Loktanella sp. DSM 29012]SEP95489.1 hypothetical protein SAMN05428995_102131 [Loktanella sp. DSM 29012]